MKLLKRIKCLFGRHEYEIKYFDRSGVPRGYYAMRMGQNVCRVCNDGIDLFNERQLYITRMDHDMRSQHEHI